MELAVQRSISPESVKRARGVLARFPVSELAEAFKVLGDPTRVGILFALKEGELCVCDLAGLFEVTPGAISHQLRLLKAHRLVKPRRDGKVVYYSLDDRHVFDLMDHLLIHSREKVA